MIDLKAARNDPDGYRAALARKGAAEAFDAVLEADERWRALVPRIDELRSKTKLKGKPSPEQLAELQQVKEELKSRRGGARGSRGRPRRGAREDPEPAARVGAGRRRGGRCRRAQPLGRAALAAGCPRAHGGRPLRHGAGGEALRLALRLSDRRHRAARVRALPRRPRPPGTERLHAGAAARARPRGGDDGHGLLPDRALEHLRAGRRRPLPDRHVGGRARRAAHGRDHPRRRATASLRGLLDQLPPRGGRGGQGHARDVPRAPVQQGRDVRLHAARGVVGRARAHARARGGVRAEARAALPRDEHRRRATSARPPRRRCDIEAWFPIAGALPRDHVLLEHDRLPGAAARHPLPRRGRPAAGAHAERDDGHRPRAARDPGELPGRGAGRAARVRRARARER